MKKSPHINDSRYVKLRGQIRWFVFGAIVLLANLPFDTSARVKNMKSQSKTEALSPSFEFKDVFADSTLRVNLILAGNATTSAVYLQSLDRYDGWAGRRKHLDSIPNMGNGRVVMRDSLTHDVLYVQNFSMLFEEWQATDEAQKVSKAMEQVVLFPMPRRAVQLTVEFRTRLQQWNEKLRFCVSPQDIQIRHKTAVYPSWTLLNNGPVDECIDLVLVGDGYAVADSARYHADVHQLMNDFFAHEPFKSEQHRFNVHVVDAYSERSGIPVPRKGQWNNTICGSMFDTFYSERYLMTSVLDAVHDAVVGVPYEYVIILANTEQYGGGGIFNSHTLVAGHNELSNVVIVHEFGHAFCGLADEYAYEHDDNGMESYYELSVEPWEPNITTRVNIKSKWQDMIDAHVPGVGLKEGAGYCMKGVYRPTEDCRMRSNGPDYFCPVCTRALLQYMDFLTK